MSLRVIAPALLANVLILLVGISLLRKDEFLDEPPPVTIGTITGMVRYAASANDKWGGALPSTVTLSSRGRMANVLVHVSKGLEGQAWHAPSQAVSVRLDPRPSTSPPWRAPCGYRPGGGRQFAGPCRARVGGDFGMSRDPLR